MSCSSNRKIIGRWFAARPRDITDKVFLNTKGRAGASEDPNGVGASRRYLHRALNASLERLGVETVDLYQLHASDLKTPFEETLSFLDDGSPGPCRCLGKLTIRLKLSRCARKQDLFNCHSKWSAPRL